MTARILGALLVLLLAFFVVLVVLGIRIDQTRPDPVDPHATTSTTSAASADSTAVIRADGLDRYTGKSVNQATESAGQSLGSIG